MEFGGVGEVFFGHFCIFEYLELVELHRGKWQLRDYVGSMEHHITGLAGEAEYEVGSAGEAVGVHQFDALACGGESVSPVDSCQSGVVGRFDTEFYYNGSNGHCDRTKHVEDFLVDTVGTCADDKAYDARDGEGFAIEFLKLIDGLMGVGKGLKISEIRRGSAVTAAVELDAFLYLLADAFLRVAVRWVEGVVATEGAASSADGAVAVRAAETGVDADFLDA